MEDVFDGARAQKVNLTSRSISFLFKAFDELGVSLRAIKDTGIERDLDGLTSALKKIASGEFLNNSGGTEEGALDLPEKISYIKVPAARLDVLMDLMEEMIIDKSRLEQLKKLDPKLEEVVEWFDNLENFKAFHRLTPQLEEME